MAKKRKIMKVDSSFHDKTFKLSRKLGISATQITRFIADEIDDIDIDIKKQDGRFKFFK